ARLTARENIAYYGALHGMARDAVQKRVEELARWLDMEALLDRRTDGFSQGERMKVAIARSIVHDPPNVVLDEPTNGLDVMTTRKLREVIRRLKEEGKCVLFSSHVMQEVSALCDEIVIVARGAVVARGSAGEPHAEERLRDREGACRLRGSHPGGHAGRRDRGAGGFRRALPRRRPAQGGNRVRRLTQGIGADDPAGAARAARLQPRDRN